MTQLNTLEFPIFIQNHQLLFFYIIVIVPNLMMNTLYLALLFHHLTPLIFFLEPIKQYCINFP